MWEIATQNDLSSLPFNLKLLVSLRNQKSFESEQQDTLRNNQIVNDNDDGCQVMSLTHMAYGQVS